jgi:hypothetical protein
MLTRVANSAAIILFVAATLLGIFIVTGRLVRRYREARRRLLAGHARELMLSLAAGEPDPQLLTELVSLDQRTWQALEPTAIGLLTKVRGDARGSLISVFRLRGVATTALRDLKARQPLRRARAAEVLGSLAQREAVPGLCRLLDDPDPDVRMTAARALGNIGDPGATTHLMESLVGPHPVPPQLVAHAVMRLGPTTQPYLETALNHPEELVRATAAEVLGLLGTIGAAERVGQALRRDSSLEVRLRAVTTLGRLGTRSALVPLLEAAEPSRDPALRAAAARALGDVGAAEAASALAALLGDPQYAVGHNAAFGLLRLGELGRITLEQAIAEAPRSAVAAVGGDSTVLAALRSNKVRDERPDASHRVDAVKLRAGLHAQEALAFAAVAANRRTGASVSRSVAADTPAATGEPAVAGPRDSAIRG